MFPAVLLTATAWDVSHGVGEGGAVVSRGFGVGGLWLWCIFPERRFFEENQRDDEIANNSIWGQVRRFRGSPKPPARGLCRMLPCFWLLPCGDVRGPSSLAPQSSGLFGATPRHMLLKITLHLTLFGESRFPTSHAVC